MEERSNNKYLLSIIAIVGIAGLLFAMNQNNNQIDDISGNAFRDVPPMPRINPPVGSKFLTLNRNRDVVVFDPNGQYKLGTKICREKGYNGCLFEVYGRIDTFYSSNNAACQGEQLEVTKTEVSPCDIGIMPIRLGDQCEQHLNNPNPMAKVYAEPSEGDYKHMDKREMIVCFK